MEGPLVFLPLASPVSTQCTLLYMHTSHLKTAQNGMERGGIRSDRWDAAWVYSPLWQKDWSWTNLEQVDNQLCLSGVYLLQWCLVVGGAIGAKGIGPVCPAVQLSKPIPSVHRWMDPHLALCYFFCLVCFSGAFILHIDSPTSLTYGLVNLFHS